MESKSAKPLQEHPDGNAELRLVNFSMRRSKYTDVQLIEAVQSSTSVRQVLGKLGLAEAGGNYSTIKHRIRLLEINIEHFNGQGWKRGNNTPIVPARPLSDILQKGTIFQSFKLKNRLFSEGLKDRKCEVCGNAEWLNQPIPLELDHINGDTTDNRIENLRILCPNCHAMTETYRGKKLAKCRGETAPS